MKKIILLISLIALFLSGNEINPKDSLADVLRSSDGKVITDFSKNAFPIKGIHEKLGLDCKDCHKEKNQKDYSSAMNSSCLECHGSYKKLGEATGHLGHNDNIHANPHYESLDCDTCHKAHKPTVNMCLRCHTQDSMKKLEVK
ncbi:cytochrome c3 family protein [Campylobacter pinnipediorum]|uniref:cytochrome c3 family protein n=1 Tax=Campylobacter pinnipediorum TaxID=1965231 RepID=UPI00084D3EAF|nr:cytochrome c3 family protein [Campylobacter pinnipediorum]